MDNKTEIDIQVKQLRELREITGQNRKAFAIDQGIPLRTLEDWEAGRRKMPDYVLRLLAYAVRIENHKKKDNKNINIIKDENGRSIVIINDIKFKSRRSIDWRKVEEYLKEYIGTCVEITETAEKVYIGSDFPDEFCHSNDKIKLKGANERAKANMASVIDKLVEIATNKSQTEDYDNKHGKKAKIGWYRYDTRFGIPVYDEDNVLIRYNIYCARMLVRCDADGKLYLYDFVRTKKETSSPHKQ